MLVQDTRIASRHAGWLEAGNAVLLGVIGPYPQLAEGRCKAKTKQWGRGFSLEADTA